LTTEKELYDTFVDTIQKDGHFANPEELSSFQLALSIHSAAPRIEAHYQYYNTSIEPLLMVAQDAACPVWVHFDGKQYCSPTLERAQQDFKGPANAGDLPFDRILNIHSDLPPSILYVDLESPLFGHFHQTLTETARAGQTSYRIRYRPSLKSSKPLAVSGYGIGLVLKRTDYIVIDDRQAESQGSKEEEKVDFEEADVDDLKPLSSSEVAQLALKTSSYIMNHEDPLETLEKISQNFPKYSSALARVNISEDFFREHQSNHQMYLGAGYNVIWMNGLQVDPRSLNAFTLLDKLRSERELISRFRETGFTNPEAISLISHVAIAQSKSSDDLQRYDWQDKNEGKVIIWLNDIENDERYKDWPTHTSAYLQMMFPGQLPAVKRDLHNVVIPLDLSDAKEIEVVLETLQMFIPRNVPIRFGIVPTTNTESSGYQAMIAYYLYDYYGLDTMLNYLITCLSDRASPGYKKTRFDEFIKAHGDQLKENRIAQETGQIFGVYKSRIEQSYQYLSRLGATGKNPPVFANGVAIPKNDVWLQAMSNRIGTDLQNLQQRIFEKVIPEETWLAGLFLEGALSRRNALIIPEDESSIKTLDMGEIAHTHKLALDDLPRVLADKDAMKQFLTHFIIVTDLDSQQGRALLAQALEFKKLQDEAELLVVHNPSTDGLNPYSAKLFEIVSKKKELTIEQFESVLSPVMGNIDPSTKHEMAETYWLRMEQLVAAFGFKPGQNGVILNGRVVGPIPDGVDFSSDDFSQLLEYERLKRISPVNTALASLGLEDRIESALGAARVTSLVAKSGLSDVPEGIFETSSTVRMNAFESWASNHTAIIKGDYKKASIQIVAAIDPTNEIGQRWIPILRVLSELNGVYLKLFLNPRERLQELPIKRFYRHVLESQPRFDEQGALVDLGAKFEGLPKQALLNLALDVPPAWVVAPKDSYHDLDNIKLSALKPGTDINAIYALEYILIEGHSRDTTTGQPPRGVQLLLGTETNHHFADTLVMANVGYFQFKANPGYWNIRLKPGPSEEIFSIDSIGANGYYEDDVEATTEIALTSFQGKTLFPRLSRKPGHEMDDVLDESKAKSDIVSKASKFASGFLSQVGLAAKQPKHADINIFSVASGHLYERMLNIMMVSVMRHTKHTVKFWFIEQFLSPSFKETLPHLAAHYGFDFEMVTYKWPHWLRGQTEKQREIWGYKILFLDVLFPLSLDKVIFVDADQIVRTDMYELVSLDLHGAPYGFTPMCDSRVEMEGYRFWKQGYWKTALRGRPYHISALYVVDLKLFRQIAAGDRLRQQYHQLSADPNSLSNLDQDLPNNMQMTLPIYSLPQEWLWCETWCSDESLKEAKTIDLCNNPETKEPKLHRARRQVPEWTVYDEEIAEVIRKAKGEDVNRVVQGGGVQEELDNKGGKIKDEL
jgi:UDP-glucose:glycoprotein glucosyltransferase